jgi:hypothetical protein
MSDPNHFFKGRNLEEDTQAVMELVERPQDVEYSISELLFIRAAIDQVPARNTEESETKAALIAKTNEFVAEILNGKKKGRTSIAPLDKGNLD